MILWEESNLVSEKVAKKKERGEDWLSISEDVNPLADKIKARLGEDSARFVVMMVLQKAGWFERR